MSPAHRCQVPGSIQSHRRLTVDDFRRGWIYSLLFANNFGTNFAVSQSGYALFRYRFSTQSGPVTDAQAAAWGQNAVSGLDATLIPSAPPTTCASLVRVDGARMLALKRAEDGRGWILRMWNPAQEESRCSLAFPGLNISAVQMTNLVEEDLEPAGLADGRLELTLPAGGVSSLRFFVYRP